MGIMFAGLGGHLADGEHQDRVSLLMPSSSKCNLLLPLGHHRRPNLRKGRRQRDKQKLLQRLLSGAISLPVPTHVQLLLCRVTLEGLLSPRTLGEGVFLIFHDNIFLFRFLIGIVSFGETYCGGLNNPRPGVYTNITSHVQWVRSKNHPQHPQPPDP